MKAKKEKLFKKENHFLRYLMIFCAFIIILFIVYFIYNNLNLDNKMNIISKHKEICLEEICIKAEVVQTDKERALGLMNRYNLNEDEGMLFIFDNEHTHSFWMKNTHISLDIIWINKNFEIVDIIQAEPCIEIECEIYTPRDKALYVLEVNKGFSLKNGIIIGNKITIKN
jgi:uncharacterized protein